MSKDGLELVKQQVSYPEFKFCAGQKDISVRRLEEIRSGCPKHVMPDSKSQNSTQYQRKATKQVQVEKVQDINTQSVSDMRQLQPAEETTELSNTEMVEQFKVLTEAIETKPMQRPAEVTSKPQQSLMSGEDKEKYCEMRRMGVSPESYRHLENLVSNDNLPLIRDIRTAHTWHMSSVESCLDVIEQQLQVRGSTGCAVELRLREILHNHMDCMDREERNSNILISILS